MDEEVTTWLSRLGIGDAEAQQAIWESYFEKLIRLARRKLGTLPRREADEEDIALSAFNSFFRGAEAGKFPRLADRHDLWKLLVTITARKASAQRRRIGAQKRGMGKVQGEAAFHKSGEEDDSFFTEQFLRDEPTPESVVIVAETVAQLLKKLDDGMLERIAQLKLEGYSNQEIADTLGCVTRTVERKLEKIRRIWSREEE